MPLAITDQFQPKYESMWRRLAQQPDSRFMSAVDVKSDCEGNKVFFDQIRPIDETQITARLQATAISEIQTEKRAVEPKKYQLVKHFDEFDEKLLAAQSLPTSPTFTEFGAGINRQIDDDIIAAATGNALTGADGTTSTALPAGQLIAVARGTGTNENFTLEKWLDVKQKFEAAEVCGQGCPDTEYFIALTSSQLRGLYNEAKITSSDYAGELEALYRGEIDKFLGGTLIRSERLAKTGDIRTCFAWVKSGLCLGMWTNPKMKLSIRNDVSDALQLRGVFQIGATRLEEEKVISIACDETA